MALFRADFSKALDNDAISYMQVASDVIAAEAILQGHKNTGKLDRSRELDNVRLGSVNLLMNAYAQDLNDGISAATVRRWLSSTSTRNEYLNGLTKFFRQRKGGSIKFARGLAIATAKVAARTGHPTPGSRKFSKNGKRTGFIDDAVAKIPPITNFPSFERELEVLPRV